MKQSTQLPNLEKTLWLKTFDDGIIDIFLGWIMIWMRIIFAISDTGIDTVAMLAINVGSIFAWVLLMALVKRKITFPRMGSVQFSRRRRSRTAFGFAIGLLLLGGIFTLSMISWTSGASSLGDTSPVVHALLLGMFLFTLFLVHAFFLDFDRLIFIGFLFSIPFPANSVLENHFNINGEPWVFLVPAFIVISYGIHLMRIFVSSHPLPIDEA